MIEQSPEQDEHDTGVLAEGVRQGVAQGIQDARGKWRNWFNNKRLLVIYLVGVVIAATWISYVQIQGTNLKHAQHDIKISQEKIERNQKAVQANCESQNKSAAKFNTFIDQAIQNANNTTGLTPEQKQAAVDRYAPLHEAILDCSHLAD